MHSERLGRRGFGRHSLCTGSPHRIVAAAGEDVRSFQVHRPRLKPAEEPLAIFAANMNSVRRHPGTSLAGPAGLVRLNGQLHGAANRLGGQGGAVGGGNEV